MTTDTTAPAPPDNPRVAFARAQAQAWELAALAVGEAHREYRGVVSDRVAIREWLTIAREAMQVATGGML